eukprot:g34092.t1
MTNYKYTQRTCAYHQTQASSSPQALNPPQDLHHNVPGTIDRVVTMAAHADATDTNHITFTAMNHTAAAAAPVTYTADAIASIAIAEDAVSNVSNAANIITDTDNVTNSTSTPSSSSTANSTSNPS